MVIDDAVKTISKIFINDVELGTGFISNGTWDVSTFNFDEATIVCHVNLKMQLNLKRVSPAAPEIYYDLIKMLFDKDVYIDQGYL